MDARGHRCPAPTLRLRRALERLESGALVRLIADDPLARIDVPHFVAGAGHELISLETTSLGLEMLVRKGRATRT